MREDSVKNWKENRALACVVLAAAILGGTFGIGGAKLSSAARSVNEAYAQNIAGDLALRAAAAQNIIAEGEAALGADAAAIEEAVAGKAAEVSPQATGATWDKEVWLDYAGNVASTTFTLDDPASTVVTVVSRGGSLEAM